MLGTFTSWAIRDYLGVDPAAAVQAALLHYARRLKSSWPPVGVPELSPGQAEREASLVFDLAVAPDIEAVLEREAQLYQVPVERVLVHAVHVYLADLERAAEGMPAAG